MVVFQTIFVFFIGESDHPYQFAGKPPRKREILIVQVKFGKVVSIERIELTWSEPTPITNFLKQQPKTGSPEFSAFLDKNTFSTQ